MFSRYKLRLMHPIELHQIGTFHCDRNQDELPWQTGILAGLRGFVRLSKNSGFEQALEDLGSFDRIWLIFHFHRAKHWNPKVFVPQERKKVGLFATRSPHRPSPVGMSCVRLVGIEGLDLLVEDHDLADGTPILDIKPYLPAVDSYPDASSGWKTEKAPEPRFLCVDQGLREKLCWLSIRGIDLIKGLDALLCLNPDPSPSNRIKAHEGGENLWVIRRKTWKILFHRDDPNRRITILDIFSGYDKDSLSGKKESRWDDLPLHIDFHRQFPRPL